MKNLTKDQILEILNTSSSLQEAGIRLGYKLPSGMGKVKKERINKKLNSLGLNSLEFYIGIAKEKLLDQKNYYKEEKKCVSCGSFFIKKPSKYASGKFCSIKCARRASSLHNREKTNEKVSLSLKTYHANKEPKYTYTCEKCSTLFKQSTKVRKGRLIHCEACKRKVKFRKNEIKNLLELSKRTQQKIIKRLNVGCTLCGWNNASCDIHHIIPKGKGGSDSDSNLIIVCPNCHREIHNATSKYTTPQLLEKSIQVLYPNILDMYCLNKNKK